MLLPILWQCVCFVWRDRFTLNMVWKVQQVDTLQTGGPFNRTESKCSKCSIQ